METVRGWMPGQEVRTTLAGHSGGGSFLFGFLESVDEVPNDIESFAFLDANYSYSDDAKHGDKLLAWLGGNNARRLTVIAYDDRNITLDGKIQPATGIPSRPSDAAGGSELWQKLASLSPVDREEMIMREILLGNIPGFLRRFQSVTFPSEQAPASQPEKSNISTATPSAVHSIIIEVMPDYLAVGSDDDFVRVPMTPMAAQRIADAFGCSLPTQKIVDQIYKAASVKLAPMPLTEAREATETILQHHTIVEKQRTGRKLGELVAGTKKDVVVTSRLKEKPDRVAIYGWHKLDGAPIHEHLPNVKKGSQFVY